MIGTHVTYEGLEWTEVELAQRSTTRGLCAAFWVGHSEVIPYYIPLEEFSPEEYATSHLIESHLWIGHLA